MTHDSGIDPRKKWDQRWSRRQPLAAPASAITAAADLLPRSGEALDVAGGTGRHALWLASLGLDVTLVDVSQVALDIAAEAAEEAGVSLRLVRRDVESDGLPTGSWDVVLIHHFLDRDLLAAVPEHLNPGGVMLFVQPTVRNRERHDRPSVRFLLEDGELASLADGWGLEVLVLEEGWGIEGRHEARFVGRRSS